MSRAARLSGVLLGTALLLALTAPTAAAAPPTPCVVTAVELGSGYAYGSPVLSADGSRIAYSAGTRFKAPYLYDRATGRSERLWPENPPGSDELGAVQSLSPDGTRVAYSIGNRSGPQGTRLLYVRDTATGTDELISPAEEGPKRGASVSGDGRRIAHQVDGTGDDAYDVFVKDRVTGERTQVDAGLGRGDLVRITADGRYAVVSGEDGTRVRDLRGDTNGVSDVFLRTVQ